MTPPKMLRRIRKPLLIASAIACGFGAVRNLALKEPSARFPASSASSLPIASPSPRPSDADLTVEDALDHYLLVQTPHGRIESVALRNA